MSHMLSHDQDFSTRRKKDRESGEKWINVVQYPNSPHMTPQTDGRETMWGIWGGGEHPPE